LGEPGGQIDTASFFEQETVVTGDLFYWPPGHTVKAEADSEVIMFSPQSEHCRVIEHIQSKLAG